MAGIIMASSMALVAQDCLTLSLSSAERYGMASGCVRDEYCLTQYTPPSCQTHRFGLGRRRSTTSLALVFAP